MEAAKVSNHSSHHDLVEMRDDKIGVMQIQIDPNTTRNNP